MEVMMKGNGNEKGKKNKKKKTEQKSAGGAVPRKRSKISSGSRANQNAVF